MAFSDSRLLLLRFRVNSRQRKGNHVNKKTAGKSAAALVVAGGLALGGLAAPASAASASIDSGTAAWEFYPDEPYFEGATPLSNGANSNWTDLDWWDYPAQFQVFTCDAVPNMGAMDSFFDGGTTELVDEDVNVGGVSTFYYKWTPNPICGDVVIDATVTFQGNSAKFDFTVVEGTVDDFDFTGYATQSGTEWSVQQGASAVGVPTDDETSLFAWKVSSDAELSAYLDENDFVASGDTPTNFSAVLTVVDYTSGTGLDSILPFFKTWAPTLDQSFGSMQGLYSGTDAPSYDLLTLEQGVAVNQVWEGTYTPFLVDGDNDYFSPENNDYILGDLPAGLTASVVFDEETGEPVVTLSGIPAEAGYFTVPLTFTRSLGGDERDYPLTSILEIVVPESETAAPAGNTPEGELAHTGFDAAPLGFAAIVMMLGAALIGVRKARKA